MEIRDVFWSAYALARSLELDHESRRQLEYCVGLIRQFPLIGLRLTISNEHRRRFVCAGFRIVYDVRETRLIETSSEPSPSPHDDAAVRTEITFMRFKRG